MGNNGGDVLARGAKSCTFGPAQVSQEVWDSIFAEELKKDVYKTESEKLQEDLEPIE
jgi:hypothetical protein